jgi:ceroid-lipofuscinosis MFS transporter 7
METDDSHHPENEALLMPTTPPPTAWSFYNDISVLIVVLITFTGDCARGVLFPVLWSFCQQLNGTVIDMGYLVAIFSFGRLIVTTPLGYFCDTYRHKISLLLANVLLLFGALLWANTSRINNIGALYAAQLIMGLGSGSLGVTRSFIVEQVEAKQRTKVLSLLTACQYAGFTVSPFIGSGLSAIGRGDLYWTYALPAYGVSYFTLLSLLGLIFFFKDIENPSVKVKKAGTTVDMRQNIGIVSIEAIIVLMMLLNVSTKGSVAVYETLGSQIGMLDYGLSSLGIGILISSSGAVGVIQILLFDSFWSVHFSDVQLILGGTVVMMIAQLMMINYGTMPPFVAYIIATILMYSIGYPIAHTAVLGGFSKIQKAGPQAALLGWFATAGSAARIVLPIISGYLDTSIDNSPFSIVLFMLALSYIFIIIFESSIKFYIFHEEKSTLDQKKSLTSFQRGQVIFMGVVLIFALASLSISSVHNGHDIDETNEPWEADGA